jgi:hypothetical protein
MTDLELSSGSTSAVKRSSASSTADLTPGSLANPLANPLAETRRTRRHTPDWLTPADLRKRTLGHDALHQRSLSQGGDTGSNPVRAATKSPGQAACLARASSLRHTRYSLDTACGQRSTG